MFTIAVLSLIAGEVLTNIGARYNSAYRSAGWNDALRAAESGVDVTLASILSQIPDVHANTSGVGLGYTQPSLVSAGTVPSLQFQPGAILTNGATLNVKNLPLPAVPGDNGVVQQTTVSLQVTPLSQLVQNGSLTVLGNGANLLGGNTNLQLLTLTSTGTVGLPGPAVAGSLRQDNDLWKASLRRDRYTGDALATPVISRQIQVILRPVYPFESAVVANDALQAPDPGAAFDSFNSSSASLNNTGGLYDSLKRLAHGAVRSNLAALTLGGTVYGDASTNGGTLTAQDANGQTHVTGTVNNAAFASLPFVNVPSWVSGTSATTASGTVQRSSASLFGSNQYRFNSITGNLHITNGLPLPSTVLIYVDGDITGGIEVDAGVTAKVYVAGSINTNASQLKNDSQVAGNLQIYGVPGVTGTPPTINLNLDANLSAAIYAPGDNVTLTAPTKSGDFSGSLVANQFKTVGAVHVHYDEALALNVGPLLRYEIASWKELTN